MFLHDQTISSILLSNNNILGTKGRLDITKGFGLFYTHHKVLSVSINHSVLIYRTNNSKHYDYSIIYNTKYKVYIDSIKLHTSTARESAYDHDCPWTFVYCYVHVLCTKLRTYVVPTVQLQSCSNSDYSCLIGSSLCIFM